MPGFILRAHDLREALWYQVLSVFPQEVDAALENLDLWVQSGQRLILLDLVILNFVEGL